MASVAILLAQEVETFLIPGTLTRAASKGEPWGSHVLIDRLHSTEYLKVVHHGADTSRPLKTARIAQSKSALDHLRVCCKSRTDYNCGKCSKCRRTQVDLELAGISNADWIFAELVPLETALAQYEVGAPIPRAFAAATMWQAAPRAARTWCGRSGGRSRRYDARVGQEAGDQAAQVSARRARAAVAPPRGIPGSAPLRPRPPLCALFSPTGCPTLS